MLACHNNSSVKVYLAAGRIATLELIGRSNASEARWISGNPLLSAAAVQHSYTLYTDQPNKLQKTAVYS